MKTIKRLETVTKAVPAQEEREYFVTSDGREFSSYEKIGAENHQKYLDEMSAFKELINYQDVDIQECEHEYYYDKSFIFDWKEEWMSEYGYMLWRIQGVKKSKEGYGEGSKNTVLSSGRYICIQYSEDVYNDNGPDYENYSGYFGLLTDYIKYLDNRIVDIQKVKRNSTEYI